MVKVTESWLHIPEHNGMNEYKRCMSRVSHFKAKDMKNIMNKYQFQMSSLIFHSLFYVLSLLSCFYRNSFK